MKLVNLLKIVFVLIFIQSVSINADFKENFEEISIDYSQNNSGKNVMTFTFTGAIYDEKYTFDYIKEKIDSAQATALESVMYENERVNKEADKEGILKSWVEKERPRIKELMEDPELFRKNQAFYRNIKSSKLVAAVLHGDYVLCYVNHDLVGAGEYVKVYPLVMTKNNQLLMTNDLADDYFFSVMSDHLGKYIQENYQ